MPFDPSRRRENPCYLRGAVFGHAGGGEARPALPEGVDGMPFVVFALVAVLLVAAAVGVLLLAFDVKRS